MKLLRWLVVAFLFGSSAGLRVNAATTTDKPENVTQALYESAMAHEGFTPESIKASRPWVTPDLYARLWKAVNKPVAKGDAPDIDGDIFLDCQDPPTKFEVGKSSIDQTKAKVDVTLIWPSEKRHLTVLLTRVDSAWKVYDVIYDKDGKLSDLLK
jgi:hypothetical protein